ncbi:MAG: metallophosphoesterase family protein [Candidatus Heimdallarchaeota archaeon]|nr:metallophosphoesterase family protein [Candidatus Heimdallarchaeota archaeon]
MITLAIFSDVHANLEALNVVNDRIKDLSPDITIYLGDTIGYGPNPKECIRAVEEMAQIHVVGNHDYALFTNNFIYFNPLPKLSLLWTKEQLSELEIQLLGSHPFFSIFPLFISEGNAMFVHGSPRKPLRDYVSPNLPSWSYNMFFEITREYTEIDFLFLGHTHKPLHIVNEKKHLLNPGSVGQPRDNDPRASFMTFKINEKTKEFEYEHVRLDYDIDTTCKKMEDLQFHPFLINRLKKGI